MMTYVAISFAVALVILTLALVGARLIGGALDDDTDDIDGKD